MTPEGKIEKYLVDRVRASGGKIRKLKWIGHNGAPDRMIWWPIKGEWPEHRKLAIIFVELKAPGKKATKTQQEEHRKMKADGLKVFIADSEKTIDDILHFYGPKK